MDDAHSSSPEQEQPATRRDVVAAYMGYLLHQCGDQCLDVVDDYCDDVDSFLAHLEERNLALPSVTGSLAIEWAGNARHKATRERRFAAVQRFTAFLVRIGYYESDPLAQVQPIELPAERVTTTGPLSIEAVELLLLPPKGDDPTTLATHFALLLFATTGMSATIVRELLLEGLDLASGRLAYRIRSNAAECLIDGVLRVAAERYLAHARPRLVLRGGSSPYLFVAPRRQDQPVCYPTFAANVKRYGESAGISGLTIEAFKAVIEREEGVVLNPPP